MTRRRMRFTPVLFACLALGATAALAQSPSRVASTYVLLGIDTLNMKEFTFTNVGDVGVNDAGGTMSWGRKSFFANNSAVVTDVLSRAGKQSSLYDLFANTVVSPLAQGGATVRHVGPVPWSPLPLISPLPPAPSCVPGGAPVTVVKNQSMTLGPGSYGSLVIQNGATLTLSGGGYCFADVKGGRKATILAHDPVQVVVMGRFRINPGSVVGPEANAPFGATEIQIGVAGNQVKFGHKSKIFGVFYAPNALLRFGRGGFYTGQFIAKSLRSDFGDSFTLEVCGNGIVDAGEQCDGGPAGNPCCVACKFAPGGTPCPDGNVCNGDETCSAFGQCVPGTPITCIDNNLCTDDGCDPAVGCTFTNNDLPCDDGNGCTVADMCGGGACQPGMLLNCDDGNACTTETCVPQLGCVPTPVSDCCNVDAECADTDLCTTNERCVEHMCVSDRVDCDDGNGCTTDGCVPDVGCTHIGNGSTCDDRDACTTGDVCAGSACGGIVLGCNDGDPCTIDSCDSGSGCLHDRIPNCCSSDAQCSDGNACNGLETCGPGGVCVPGAPPFCNDGKPCTTDTCDPAIGCRHDTSPDGTACPNGNKCDGRELCFGGICTDQPDLNCDDGDPCTIDSCDRILGCLHTPVTVPIAGCACPNGDSECDNGNACDGVETCDVSHQFCRPGTPLVCTTTDQCQIPTCDPQTGCGSEPKPDETPCDDGNACTGPDQCAKGVCKTPPVVCDDRDFCTADSCDPATACTYTPISGCTGQALFCTLPQEGYGSNVGVANGGQGWITNNPAVLPMSIGAPGTGASVTINTQLGLIHFLPASGSPNVLCGNPMPVPCPGDLVVNGLADVPDPIGSGSGGDGAGTLAGETIALSLSVGLSNSGANPTGLGGYGLPGSFCTCDALGGRIGPFPISQCIRDNATTVNNLLSLANQALRGIPLSMIDPCLTKADIATTLNKLNHGFDRCRTVCSCTP